MADIDVTECPDLTKIFTRRSTPHAGLVWGAVALYLAARGSYGPGRETA